MPSLFSKLVLFLSSYLALWLIFFIQFFFSNNLIGCIIAIVFIVLSSLSLFIYPKLLQTFNPISVEIVRVNRRDGEAMSYIISYLIPFIALPSAKISDFISLCVIFLVLGILYINSEMIHINPTLNLLGWHIFEVTDANDITITIIAKTKLKNKTALDAIQIGDNIYWGKRKKA